MKKYWSTESQQSPNDELVLDRAFLKRHPLTKSIKDRHSHSWHSHNTQFRLSRSPSALQHNVSNTPHCRPLNLSLISTKVKEKKKDNQLKPIIRLCHAAFVTLSSFLFCMSLNDGFHDFKVFHCWDKIRFSDQAQKKVLTCSLGGDVAIRYSLTSTISCVRTLGLFHSEPLLNTYCK